MYDTTILSLTGSTFRHRFLDYLIDQLHYAMLHVWVITRSFVVSIEQRIQREKELLRAEYLARQQLI